MIVTKDTLIGEILEADQSTASYFFEMGMYCIGCPHSAGESLEQATAVHGTDLTELIAKLNQHMNSVKA